MRPDYPRAYLSLAFALMENRRPKEAAAAYRKAYDTGDPAVRKAARHELRTRFYRHPESNGL
jgi:cytochrome c-type biogenesis protein CcmH/NrfG